MNGYIAFYRNTQTEVHATTSANAQTAAYNILRERFPRTRIRAWEITVMIAERDGEPVIHSTAAL